MPEVSFATRLQTSSRIPSTGAAPGGRAGAPVGSPLVDCSGGRAEIVTAVLS